jgi:hypothetical protein
VALVTVPGQEEKMCTSTNRVVVGLDNGGNVNNATVLETSGRFLVDALVESPSLVREGPDIAIDALAQTFDDVLALTGTAKTAVVAVGLDTPGPASAEGVISSRAQQTSRTPPGAVSISAVAWKSGCNCPSSITTTATRRRSMPITCISGLRAVSTLPSRQ